MKKFLIIILILFAVYSCVTQSNTSTTTSSKPKAYNFANIYNPTNAALFFEYNIYFNSENSANVFFDITFNKNNFNKNQQQIDEEKKQLKIKYILRNQNDEIADSSSFTYNLIDYKNFANYFSITIPKKQKYKLTMSIYDSQMRFTHRVVELFDNSQITKHNFLIHRIDDEIPEIIHNNYLKKNSSYKFISKYDSEILVEYYKPTEYVLNPIYQININKKTVSVADSTFLYTANTQISFDSFGDYVFKDKNTKKTFFNILCIDKNFPLVATVGDMLEPLKIITTDKEYKKLFVTENIKQEIDKYWLSLSNSQKLAKEQIRVFYNRVKLANIFFTEDIEGWKSDRGIIYVLFGPPSVVNLSDEGEDWYYGNDPSVAGLLFIFEKKETQHTKISYQLIRDNTYQPTWAQALSTWKKGRIFSL